MLVLSRHTGEGVHVGKEIEVVVLEISDQKVRLGFKAPQDVEIWRDEIFRQLADGPEGPSYEGGPEGPSYEEAEGPYEERGDAA